MVVFRCSAFYEDGTIICIGKIPHKVLVAIAVLSPKTVVHVSYADVDAAIAT
jgi:hypothetical protein